jgi:hypothetical protein
MRQLLLSATKSDEPFDAVNEFVTVPTKFAVPVPNAGAKVPVFKSPSGGLLLKFQSVTTSARAAIQALNKIPRPKQIRLMLNLKSLLSPLVAYGGVDALRFRFIRVRQRQSTDRENKREVFNYGMNTDDTDLSI